MSARHLLFLCAVAALAHDSPVRIADGAVSGTTTDGVRAYKGIPYAAPPSGALRWKPPQPVTPWKGVLAATDYSPICMQPASRGAGFYGGRRDVKRSEDCLYLNVWTAARAAEKRPVMVWIHGGGFQTGSGSSPMYDGAALARKGVVLVTIQYRLGVLGFLSLPELSAESERRVSGNYGVLDQIAALEWVRRNIEAFGGDPGNVTIFGQSGGSWGVCYLLATPLAKGLFHRAIGESGCAFDRDPHLREKWLDYEPAEQIGEQWVLKTLGGALKLAALRDRPADDFGKFIAATANIDGWVFPEDIYPTFAGRKQNHVPVIAGNTADEGTVVTLAMPETIPDSYGSYIQQLRKTYGALADDIVKVYRIGGEGDVRRASEEIFRDSKQVWQMRILVRVTSRSGDPAYLYYFTRVPPGPNSERMGAFHAAEIPYVFANLTDPRRPYQDLDRKLSDTMSSYWVNFARTGNPNGLGLPEWPKFDPSDERSLEFGDAVKVAPAPNKSAMDIFDRYEAPRLGKGF